MIYTIGEIYRLGFIKTRDGMPYKHKSAVSKWLKRNMVLYTEKKTRWGKAKYFDINSKVDYKDIKK